MKNKILLIILFVTSLFLVVSVANTQSNAIMEIVDVEGTLVVNWVATPTERVITNTPGPSQTPWIITATPEIIATATQEFPTNTPTATNTPDPLCLVQNQAGGNIRVRNLPSTSGTETVGYIENGQYIHPVAYYVGPDYTWYRIWWDEVIYVWTAADFYTYISGDCEGLLYENPF